MNEINEYPFNDIDVLKHQIPDPSTIFALNEEGEFTNKKKPKQERIISQYWGKQHKKIALLILFSAGILCSILLQETDLLNIIFGTISNAIFGFIMGLIF